jgi:phosphoglycerate dehydrogenase-like enzyme
MALTAPDLAHPIGNHDDQLQSSKGASMVKACLLVTLAQLAPVIARYLGDRAEIVIPPAGTDLGEWLVNEGRSVRAAIISGLEPFTDAILARLPDLRHLAIFGEGMESVDQAAALRRGITISNAEGLHAPEVANYAVAMMFAARRRLVDADAWVRQGRWLHSRMPVSHAVEGTSVGIVGLGQIGMAIGERLEPFGCEIGWWGRSAKRAVRWARHESLLDLASASDVLVVAIRGNHATRGLIDRPIIDALGPDGLLVNVARGFVVDEAELIASLSEGRLGQAALDVFDPEPARPERWADVPNVLLSPHQAGATIETIDRLAAHAVDSVRKALLAE